jgi:hypothetical protein
MPKIVNEMMKPFLKYYALRFLGENDIPRRQEQLLREKIRKASRTSVGRKLGLRPDSKIKETPLTFYGFYKPFFENPQEGDFIYPVSDYNKVYTSGTMSKPKVFLVPREGLWENLKTTGFSFLFLSTHDGKKSNFEVGEVIYQNTPGGQFISSFFSDVYAKKKTGWSVHVPDINLSYQEKVDWFVEHYKEVDIAYMTVTSLLDQIYPRIGHSFKLKGFFAQDRPASVLKERIKEVTGTYPKTIFGSTETMFAGLPSIAHPGGFFFDWRVLWPEFLPEKGAISGDPGLLDPPPDTVPLMNVEVGKRYQMIVTPYLNDLVRYVMPDIVECVDKGDDILGCMSPVFMYYARCDNLLVLHNFTRIMEEELIQILTNAGIPYVDFTARRESEGSHEYMRLFIELSSKISEDELVNRIHQGLIDFDRDWRDLTNFMNYLPLKVTVLPRGSFHRYLKRKAGLPKIPRIEMREELLNELLSNRS